MPTESPNRRFMRVYNVLPPEAQQAFVEKHLANLIDLMPQETFKKVHSAVSRLQTQYKTAPNLDLKGKRKQVNHLLEALGKDSKASFIQERTNRDEILEEIIHSLTSWLNDIWTVVYEHNIQFQHAHRCLMFVAVALAELCDGTGVGGCKCIVMNLSVQVTIKDKSGQTVKRTQVSGPQNVDRILLWIWRDLMVSMRAKGTKKDKDSLNEMLEDIESVLGFTGLERLLYGGRKYDEDGEDEDEDDPNFEDESGDEDGPYDSDFDIFDQFHAHHWLDKFTSEQAHLRDQVETRLFNIFRITPSLALHNSIVAITQDSRKTDRRISEIITEVAGSTAETLVAALDIQIANCDAQKIISLLDAHSHLLRPRDSVTVQCAAAVLGDSGFNARGLSILETELNNCLQSIYISVRGTFSAFEEEAHKKELTGILKLRSGSSARRERIENWVEAIMTSSSSYHPVAIAALMMGLPMGPAMEDGDESDFFNFMDFDQNDPDLEDLREELRPKLKHRFEGWAQLALVIKGGVAASAKLYVKAIEQMPFLRANDVATAMLGRLGDRPSRAHIYDGLEALSSFCKTQRKKLNAVKKEQDKRAAALVAAAAKASASTNAGASSSTTAQATAGPSPSSATTSPSGPPSLDNGAPFTFAFPSTSHQSEDYNPYLSPHLPYSFLPGGMEDVD